MSDATDYPIGRGSMRSGERKYVVRVENFGVLIQERPAADLADAVTIRRRLADAPENAHNQVEIYRPENIDLGCPFGLTRAEQEDIEEMLS